MKLLSLLAALLAFASTAHAQVQPPPKADDCVAKNGPLPPVWEGTAFAIDGDTLAGVGLKPHIRIWGIQAPELRDAAKDETVPGMRARAQLGELLGRTDHQVRCEPMKYDRYCRWVALCLVQFTDVGRYMIASGMAYGFYLEDIGGRATPMLSIDYAENERVARQEKRGLWPVWMGGKDVVM